MPLRLPTIAREPITVTCEPDADTPGIPNAHLTFSFGTSAALSPAAAADWNRVFRRSPPHPFQDAPASGSFGAFAAEQKAVLAIASRGALYEPGARPVTNAATARRSPGLSAAPCRLMLNERSAVSTASGDMPRSASRFGMRGIEPS